MSLEILAPERHMADGQYAAESVGVDDLRAVLTGSQAFTIHEEVVGQLLYRHPTRENKGLRVDMILTPNPKLRDAGWDIGQIGIECKRSGERLGPAVAQAIDYRQAGFEIRNRQNGRTGQLRFRVFLEWTFVFPFNPPKADLESIMTACGVGVVNLLTPAHAPRYLRFKMGGYKALEVYEDGNVNVNRNPTPGRKVGCR